MGQQRRGHGVRKGRKGRGGWACQEGERGEGCKEGKGAGNHYTITSCGLDNLQQCATNKRRK